MADHKRLLIITADDFGAHVSVNEAVEWAHRDGVLSATSLMVGAPAAADAVARAQALPSLRVGLHLVLTDGQAMLPHEDIPDLVDRSGRFPASMLRPAFGFFFLPRVRRQLAMEISAQFEAFAATGLLLDHVNTHKHFHLHPTVLKLILEIGPRYGLRAMRLPDERGATWPLRPWLALLRYRLARAKIAHNDYVVGISQSGRFDETALLGVLRRLPPGVGEIYLHPALISGSQISPSMHNYHHRDELCALLSPRVRQALDRTGLQLAGFAELANVA